MELAHKAEQLLIVRVIRTGLVRMIPVLLVGAFALVFASFPVQAYQDLITGFAGGILKELFTLIHTATFGVLSLYMTMFICTAYMHIKADSSVPITGSIAASLISFFMLAGVSTESFGLDCMGPKSMFMAILTGLGASALYLKLYRMFDSGKYKVFSRGADRDFNRMITTVIPIVLVSVIFALLNMAIVTAFDVDSFHRLTINFFNSIFMGGGPTFGKGFFFVLFSSVLWFFGIHGSDTLEGVMQEYFVPELAENQAAVMAGQEPVNVLTKQLFDCFVLMGGCGALICLLIAILIFSHNQGRRRLGAAAALPMIFNINELMVFGLPIIYNPIMLIPFLATPLACYSISYVAMSSGIVPVITGHVEWTTPVLIGGYLATGSIAGSLLQLFNIAMGVLIYAPFVRMLDRQTEGEARRSFNDFNDFFKTHEAEYEGVSLLDEQNVYGEFARNLTAELRHDMLKSIEMHYQPQYSYDGKCEGVEALLRWTHPVYGTIYPPLLVKLAEDGGFLPELEEEIILHVLGEEEMIIAKYGENIKISFNVTGKTVITSRFLQFCTQLNAQTPFAERNICIEVTEQAALSFNDSTLEALGKLRSMGLKLAIDDFAMGHTSIDYLKHNIFDYIKLDGSLVKGLSKHENCKEIIASILKLAESLNMTVIAEFVETEQQRDTLRDIGCNCYQGWLYSPARPLDN